MLTKYCNETGDKQNLVWISMITNVICEILIKSNDIEAAHDLLMTAIDKLIPWGVRAIVLGCTEIPLAITETQYKNIPLINSIDSLVKTTIKEFNKVSKLAFFAFKLFQSSANQANFKAKQASFWTTVDYFFCYQ